MINYICYLLISISFLSLGIIGYIKANIKTLEWEIQNIKEELNKKPELTEAEKETHYYEWNEDNQSWDKKERE